MSAQALSPEWLVLETQDSHAGPRTKQEQVFKQELILDTRAGPEWQLWQILLFKLALNQSNFHIVFGRHKPGLLGFY